MVKPQQATKDHMIALSPLPPLGWGGESEEKKAKLVDSLKEQQRK